MLLGPVSYLDCVVFCVFLAPQLVWHVGLMETLKVVVQVLPFLVIQLPAGFLRERFLLRAQDRPLFVRQASPFEDVVVRCVRYAFAHIPPRVGRVFFGKEVALPWMRWRMLRHGYLRSPVRWREYNAPKFRGIWAVTDPAARPDLVVYYAHGGGFSMGSTYFYLEFLLTWLDALRGAGYQNPAVFGLEYTLVPDLCFPAQLEEVVAGYDHVLGLAGDPSLVCVAGDSAGGTLMLSLLLHLAKPKLEADKGGAAWQGAPSGHDRDKPGMAVLISPWPTLQSALYENNRSDYLSVETLQLYASQYAGSEDMVADPLASPGNCTDVRWWKEASPSRGVFITYGKEEVFAPEIERLVQVLQRAGGACVSAHGEEAGVHAWPVVALFLGHSTRGRRRGLQGIVQEMKSCLGPAKKMT